MLRFLSVNVEDVQFESVQVPESLVAPVLVTGEWFRRVGIVVVQPQVHPQRLGADEAAGADVALEAVGMRVAQLVLAVVAGVVEGFAAELADVRLDVQVNVLVVVELRDVEESRFAARLGAAERPVVGVVDLDVSLHEAGMDERRAAVADDFLSYGLARLVQLPRRLHVPHQVLAQRFAEQEALAALVADEIFLLPPSLCGGRLVSFSFQLHHRPTFRHLHVVLLRQVPLDGLLVLVGVLADVAMEKFRLRLDREAFLAAGGAFDERGARLAGWVMFLAEVPLDGLFVLVRVATEVAVKHFRAFVVRELRLNFKRVRRTVPSVVLLVVARLCLDHRNGRWIFFVLGCERFVVDGKLFRLELHRLMNVRQQVIDELELKLHSDIAVAAAQAL